MFFFLGRLNISTDSDEIFRNIFSDLIGRYGFIKPIKLGAVAIAHEFSVFSARALCLCACKISSRALWSVQTRDCDLARLLLCLVKVFGLERLLGILSRWRGREKKAHGGPRPSSPTAPHPEHPARVNPRPAPR